VGDACVGGAGECCPAPEFSGFDGVVFGAQGVGGRLATANRNVATVAGELVVSGAEDMWDLTVVNSHDFYVSTKIELNSAPELAGLVSRRSIGSGLVSKMTGMPSVWQRDAMD
jgi:hypothetical protein